ncbi:hypothetical protein ACFL59_10725 [Planctomycetota bacterium]
MNDEPADDASRRANAVTWLAVGGVTLGFMLVFLIPAVVALGALTGVAKWLLASGTASLGASVLAGLRGAGWLLLIGVPPLVVVALLNALLRGLLPPGARAWSVIAPARRLSGPLFAVGFLSSLVLDHLGQTLATHIAIVAACVGAAVLLLPEPPSASPPSEGPPDGENAD